MEHTNTSDPINETKPLDGDYFFDANRFMNERLHSTSPLCLILGDPGVGVGFYSKEIALAPLNEEMGPFRTIIYDSIGEYPTTQIPDNGCKIDFRNRHINIFDLYLTNDLDDFDQTITINEKIDMVISFCSLFMPKMTAEHKVAVYYAVDHLYESYRIYCKEHNTGYDAMKVPTFTELFDVLENGDSEAGHEVAEYFNLLKAKSNNPFFDIFAHRTDVDIDQEFVLYNIADMCGNNDFSMFANAIRLLCISDTYNRMNFNLYKVKGTSASALCRTSINIPHCENFFHDPIVSDATLVLCKRARTHAGVVTISSNNPDAFFNDSKAISTMCCCDWVILLKMSENNIKKLASPGFYNLSDAAVDIVLNRPMAGILIASGLRYKIYASPTPYGRKP